MTFSHSRKAIYGAGMKKWSSYLVNSPSEIQHHSSHPLGVDPEANSADTRTRAIFVLAAQKPPYLVYGNPFYEHARYGNVFSVDENGGLLENVQNYEYQENSAIHGMVFDPEEEYLYSADMWANKIWCHKKVRLGQIPAHPIPLHPTDPPNPNRRTCKPGTSPSSAPFPPRTQTTTHAGSKCINPAVTCTR